MAAASLALSTASEGAGIGSYSNPRGMDAASRRNKRPCVRPVDLVHLARQSLGDRELELEILSMFRSQSQLYIGRLTHATTADERKMAAHTILGSARGIGAWRVAEEAEKLQALAGHASNPSELRRTLEEANEFISEILADV